MPFNSVVLNMPCGTLKLKSCQIRKETFFFKHTKKGSVRQNKLKLSVYLLFERVAKTEYRSLLPDWNFKGFGSPVELTYFSFAP